MIRSEAIALDFHYAAGRARGAFLRALRDEGRILGSRCRRCDLVWCPSEPFCPHCAGDTEGELPVGPAGELRAWATALGRAGAPSTVYGLVVLDGADSPILHRLLLTDECDLRKRMRVLAQVRPVEERRGSILDIEGFRVQP